MRMPRTDGFVSNSCLMVDGTLVYERVDPRHKKTTHRFDRRLAVSVGVSTADIIRLGWIWHLAWCSLVLMNGLSGGLVGGFSCVIRVLIPSIRLDASYVCRVNVLHWPSRHNIVHVCRHRGPIPKVCPNFRRLYAFSHPM